MLLWNALAKAFCGSLRSRAREAATPATFCYAKDGFFGRDRYSYAPTNVCFLALTSSLIALRRKSKSVELRQMSRFLVSNHL